MMKLRSKKLISLLAIMTIVLMSIMPVWAEDQAPDFSPWAMSKLAEGEKYGIYPQAWYYDGFRSDITEERLEMLLQAVDAKLSEVAVKTTFKPLVTKADLTRGDVITRMFNVLGKNGIVEGTDAVAALKEFGVVAGMPTGMALEQTCKTEHAVVMAISAIQNSYEKMNAGGKGMFWKVEKNGNTVYLLGSIHLGKTALYPIHSKVEDAFAASDVLAVEANVLDAQSGIPYFQEKSMLPEGKTLKSTVSAETYANFSKVAEQYGFDPAQYEGIKPWRVANDLSSLSMTSDSTGEQTDDAAAGIDLHFIIKSYLTGKPVFELEGIPYQADLFDGLSASFQEDYLNSVLEVILNPTEDGSNSSADLLDEWLTLWKAGDLENFDKSFSAASAGEETELTKMLFGKRDLEMTEKIVKMLEGETPATYFVVVGAGHLVPDNSIVDRLKEKGYTVEWQY